MRTSDMIKSKFWRAGDVQGRPPIVLTIADVTEELIGRGSKQEAKCFLWFNENLKGLQLNKTRVRLLEAAFGPDSELWIGKKVKLSFDPTVEFGGRAVGGVGLQTPHGVVYQAAEGLAGWGAAPQGSPADAASRPPPPVWDEKRQTWVTPQPAQAIARPRPPQPVWNETTQSWDLPSQATQKTAPPLTISQRVAAAAQPATEFVDQATGEITTGAQTPDFDDAIPF